MDKINRDQPVGTALCAVRSINSSDAMEVYLTLIPTGGGSARGQVVEVYEALAEVLEREGTHIFSERVYGDDEALGVLADLRRAKLTSSDVSVPPMCLRVTGLTGEHVTGVQVWAVRTAEAPRVVEHEGVACGRMIRHDGVQWLMLSGLSAPGAGDEAAQARRMFEKAGDVLRAHGMTMRDVARTWLWLAEINQWYARLNEARSAFFRAEGLIGGAIGKDYLPASTGIGMQPADGGACAMDLIAVTHPHKRIELIEAGGDQPSAHSYGSAFSRAACAATPGGRSVFVSGTAAINAAGRSEHLGDIEAQIRATLNHVRAILRDAGAASDEVLSATAYCRSERVREVFEEVAKGLVWPCLVVPGQVCRTDLLFEMEVTAGRGRGG